MTLDDVLAETAAELDAHIVQARQQFEQSLIDHQAPVDELEDLRAYERAYMQAWRARVLFEVRAQLFLEHWTSETVQ